MADKTVTYRLLADITQFRASMAQAATSVQTTANRMTAANKEGAAFRKGLGDVSKVAGRVGLVAAAGLGAAIISAANFDQAMSRVAAATHESSSNMDLLRASAIKAGAETVFSAGEAADAIEALAKAGVSTKDILGGGLRDSLNLAAAGSLEVGQAAEIAATTMNQFGLAGSDVGHIADVLAASAGKAQGEVTDMAGALQYVGPVAAQMGLTLDETAGAIAELASQGILGTQAGTSLRGMLTALTSPSKIAAKTMQDLGINMYDAQGQFVGFDGVAGQLHKTMGDLKNAERDQALGRIFGNEQITAARILYAGGAGAVRAWTASVNDSGYAAETARLKMDNLKGDLENLKGSLETALIGTGEGSQGALRGLTQGLTGVINTYNKLPDAAKSATAGLLGITAVTGGGLWFAAKSIQAVGSMRESLGKLGEVAPKTASALKSVGTALVALEVLRVASDALDSLVQSFDSAAPSVERLTRNLDALAQGGNTTRALGNIQDEFGSVQGLLDDTDSKFGNLGASMQGYFEKVPLIGGIGANQLDLVDQATGRNIAHLREAQGAFENLDASFMSLAQSQGPKAARKAFDDLAQSYSLTASQQDALLSRLPEFAALLGDTGKQGFWLQQALAGIVPSFHATGSAAQDAAGDLEAFKTQLLDLKGLLDKRDALRNYQAAIDDFRKSFKHLQGDDFNIDVKAGRDNQAKLDAIVSAAGEAISHIKDVGKSGAYIDAVIGRLKFMAKTMHLPQSEVRVLIAQLRALGGTVAAPKVAPDGIPKAHSDIDSVSSAFRHMDALNGGPAIKVSGTATAISDVASLRYQMSQLQNKTVFIDVVHRGGTQVGTNADGNIHDFYASGGYLPRIGDQQPQIRPFSGARGLTWSEQGSGPWEAFISGSPAKADRSKAIASDVVSRLGGTVQFAHGGMVGGGSSSSAGRVVERVIVERLADRVTLVDKNGAIGEFAVRAARSEISDDRGYRATLARQGVG